MVCQFALYTRYLHITNAIIGKHQPGAISWKKAIEQYLEDMLAEELLRRTFQGADGLVVRAPKWVPLYEVEAALREGSNFVTAAFTDGEEATKKQLTTLTRTAGATVSFVPGGSNGINGDFNTAAARRFSISPEERPWLFRTRWE